MSDLVDDFWAAVASAARTPGLAGPYLTGSRLAWAAAEVLGAQGAAIGLATEATMRVPWGASDDDAAAAEALQFTTGEGPCLAAYADQDTMMATGPVIAASWPTFDSQLRRRTPYRSVFCAPLRDIGVLDLYFTDPAGCQVVDVGAAVTVGRLIFDAMVSDQILSRLDTQRVLPTPAMTRRSQVAVAIGMLTVTLRLSYPDALAVIRGHAFATDQLIDDVAARLISGDLDPQQLVT